ncbi:Sensor protein ZraS [Aquisphaera giovannonii]|uniref:histidine kinase n=1 Tax=Aquisphaera giovannonii TaxID=406548 RepID=A0A5B9W920_9BACT|nr:response regulator [Aquisphaera giovannonii]QEH37098.1 Sensor protein ZraS [Aquisphaera giovannonii]
MAENVTVLIVDDSAGDRALFRTILTRGGYTVFDVARGEDAVPKALQERPHIVVLDVNLPDMDGLAVCRAIRANSLLANVPVLMLTVRHDDADVLAGLEAGADDYVAKDSAPELVLARVKRLVQYQQLLGLTTLNRQLVQAGRLLAGIIHEIRGPLSVIRGSAELLRMNVDPGRQDPQWLDSILRGIQLLQSRLDHLMAMVRSGPPQIHDVDAAAVAREAVDLFSKGLPPNSRGIAYEVRCEVPASACAKADAGRLIQVLIDLLSNAQQAIASVRRTGKVQVVVAPAELDGPWVTLSVRDDGPGIAESHLGRIFEPFFTTKEGGTGYGLHLASEILKEQGGRLTVENNSDGGACFRIWLPRGHSARTAEGAAIE